MSALDNFERVELRVAESVIEEGLKTFVDVGQALADIRDGRLYRADHATFEDYCSDRWGIGKSRAYQLINAAATTSTIVDAPVPANEGQARALIGLDPEQAAETMRTAHEATDGNLTAAAIKAARPDTPAPADDREADAGAGLPNSSDAVAMGAPASEVLTPPAAFEHGNSAPPEAPRPEVSPLEAIVRDHEQNSTSAWRKRFAAEMARSGDLFRNVPADVAENAGPELLELLEQHIVWANDWHGRVRKAQPNRLTVINGGSR
jgi:hypothetical protein